MKEISLKTRLTNFLQRKETFIASGELQRLAQENGYWSPQNTGRRLRELVEDGILEVEYRKGHAWYRFKGETIKPEPKKKVEWINNKPTLVLQ